MTEAERQALVVRATEILHRYFTSPGDARPAELAAQMVVSMVLAEVESEPRGYEPKNAGLEETPDLGS